VRSTCNNTTVALKQPFKITSRATTLEKPFEIGTINVASGSLPWYMVRIDSQADVSACTPKLLQGVTEADHILRVKGINGGTVNITDTGYLPGLFNVYSSNMITTNVLAMDDMERRFEITYEHGRSLTAHTPLGNLV
jgi:hypothetical protein